MATESIEVEIVETQTVKPSSPTPHDLRNFKLSLLDQFIPESYIIFFLFYPNLATSTPTAKAINDKYQHLLQSLAKTLTHFYPFAGRIKSNVAIECNDDGAQVVKARVKCSLSDILERPDPEMLTRLLPSHEAAGTGALLYVQVNLFECGGMAIGLSASHKIGDASTVCTFINSWAATAHQSNKVILPQFGVASLFPVPPDFSDVSEHPALTMVKEKCITSRYVFDNSKISILQSKASSSLVPKPTRAEAVSALIWKCAIEASSKSSSSNTLGSSPIRPSIFLQAVNLRKNVTPPLPDNLAGNLLLMSTSKAEETTSNVMDLKDLVAKIRGGVEDLKECATKIFDPNEAILQVLTDYFTNLTKDHQEIETYICSSWCRFPYYEADFGWGKPSWVSFASLSATKNIVVLVDKRDCNGIEAWLSLSEESMALFESNPEVLAYASLNPRVTY